MLQFNEPPNWYLVQIKPNCSAMAKRNLLRQGISVFQPLELITMRQSGRFIEAKRPYFPGYIFVGIERGQGLWRAITSTRGVSRLVSFGSNPAIVPNTIVDQLKASCDANGCIVSQTLPIPGDQVQISQGPLADFSGQVETLASNRRVWVLLDIMGKETRVSIDGNNLMQAS